MSSRFAVRLLKLVFLLSTATFLLLQLRIQQRGAGESTGDGFSSVPGERVPKSGPETKWDRREVSGRAEKIVKVESAAKLDIPSPQLPLGGARGAQGGAAALPSPDEIRRVIEDNNANSEILNEAKFGPVEAVDYVVLVQVHNRSKYLEKLVQSLSVAKGIERALLIFSHDFYDNRLNEIVKKIDFCRVIQIFYPWSIQLHPDSFPGQDPRDCPPTVDKNSAQNMNCTNWRTPDKYGHYRVAKFTQIKHHWWWKLNYAFDGIDRLRNFTGYALFLEEDHYVSPDFVHVMDYIVKHRGELCAECSIITLGIYLKNYNGYGGNSDKLAVYPWFSSKHNMGMAFDRATFERIKACAKMFCEYDDYNWDWSLLHVDLKCLQPQLSVVYTKAPRVFHIGDCGIHHQGQQCTADASATKVAEVLESAKDRLFPARLEVNERSRRMLKPPKENGGWGDTRDHQLCLNHSKRL